jgi:hypothetical protein
MAFSILDSTQEALRTLVSDPSLPIPPEAKALLSKTTFTNDSEPILPCPFRQLEAVAALKAIEAAVANAIGKVRFGIDQDVTIDLQHATLFLLMAYIATVDGLGKQDPAVKRKLKGMYHSCVHNFSSQTPIYWRPSPIRIGECRPTCTKRMKASIIIFTGPLKRQPLSI